MRDCLIEPRQELVAAQRFHHFDGVLRRSRRGWWRSVIPREQNLKRGAQGTRDSVSDIRRNERVSVLDRAQPPFADPNFMGEFLLRGSAVASVAQFLDFLPVELNFPHGILLSNQCSSSCL
jgi:hypothetical protein